MGFRQFVLGGQPIAESNGAAENPVTQDKIDPLCLRFAEPIAQCPPPDRAPVGVTLYLVFFSIQY